MKSVLSDKGFTLVELLLAAAILVFAIVGLAALFINVALLNDANRNLTIATSHAQFVMEKIKDANFSSLSTDITNGIWNYNKAAIDTAGLTALKGETITTVASGTNLLDITITVSWQDRTSKNRSFVLEALITG